jgi:FkbM family methyltransferase
MNKSYSQEGEDLVVKRYFEGKKKYIFYVDVGSHHPFRFSNTAFFYQSGSKGINIDANKQLIELFNNERPNDINIHSGVGIKKDLTIFYEFEEPALSTFSSEIYLERISKGLKLKQKIETQIKPLVEILSDCNVVEDIDFMNIDVEGLDFEVLQSNNWQRFRPKLILVEIRDFDPEFLGDEISLFLKEQGYSFFAKTFKTVFFERNN